MNENPMDRLSTFNRVSIRAVLVNEGEDPSTALSEAGIVNPVSISVVVGENLDLSGGILGDGLTPNLTGVLETEPDDDFDSSPYIQPNKTGRQPDAAQPDEPVTAALPPAFGSRPLAPVRKPGA
ncbi:MAG: hypothetical protein P4L90_23345 [Rhodopila sp.]|nr:hypothetical protein [Rhodopila sp.]